jgi:hypothetical protein
MSDDVLNAILTALPELQQGQSRLETGRQELEHDLTGLRTDLMARMDRRHDTLTCIREDIDGNMRASNSDP